jgi:hypothetical protein
MWKGKRTVGGGKGGAAQGGKIAWGNGEGCGVRGCSRGQSREDEKRKCVGEKSAREQSM